MHMLLIMIQLPTLILLYWYMYNDNAMVHVESKVLDE